MKEKSPESIAVEYCNSNSSITSSGINWTTTTTDSNSYVLNGSSSAGLSIWPDINYVKSKFVEGIFDGEIELCSLIDKSKTEIYDIEDITFKDKKTRITCQKEIDLSYVESLKCNSEILLEFSPMQIVDYKKDAIEHQEGSFVVNGSGILMTHITNPPLTWTYTPGNTTYGATTMLMNTDCFSITGNISCA